MISENTQFYLDAIKHEVEQLDERFTGNTKFEINWKEGTIGNMNVILGKSLRKIERPK